LVGAQKTFVGVDNKGIAAHFSSSSEGAVALNASVGGWAKENTAQNGVGIFLVAVSGGYHSLMLIVDRRGDDVSFWLQDQHGNSSTNSSSSFDRLVSHSQKEIDDHMLKMVQSWGGSRVISI
jgi:hypothetical protein